MPAIPAVNATLTSAALDAADRAALLSAFKRLENPSLVVRLSSAFGLPVESVGRELGRRASPELVDAVAQSTRKAIELTLRGSLKTLDGQSPGSARPGLHTAAAVTSGAVGGFFGAPALLVELPLTTGIMFRSMADIARAEGESLADPGAALNVMQVFAFGSGRTTTDDAAETSYYGARLALSKAITEALQYVGKQGASGIGAPVVVRLVSAIAHRFGIVVTQKAMAQAVPLIGAVGGGLVNAVFISHFQDMARGHFVIRRLERKYSEAVVREAYLGLRGGAESAADAASAEEVPGADGSGE